MPHIREGQETEGIEYQSPETLRAISEAIARDEVIKLTVALARAQTFGDYVDWAVTQLFDKRPDALQQAFSVPPYDSLIEAWAEIERQVVSAEARENRQAWKEIRAKLDDEGIQAWPSDNPLVQRIRHRMPKYFQGLESAGRSFFLTLPAEVEAGFLIQNYLDHLNDSLESSPRKAVGREELAILHYESFREFGGAEIYAHTEELWLLGTWGAAISKDTKGFWSQNQAVEHILTGKVPTIGRWSVQATEMYEVGTRTIISLNTPITEQELRDLYRELRKTMGTYRKKSLKSEDELLIQLYEDTPQLTWAKRLELWNVAHPERTYKRPSALITAYQRALRRANSTIGEGSAED